MKIIAMYLPQFHRTAENDEWWGEGFTDWNAVKAAKPLFDGHYEPRLPLDDRYYDLLDKESMEWQAGLMHEYGIDGLCIYHYWFKDGRKILEKPAENLLGWKDIDMPFCFCWANETWARSWSNIYSKNTWADTFEKDGLAAGREVLLLQEYGMRRQWEEHFLYLLPFFKDERYIRIDNKPVFLIYHTHEILCIQDMIEYWREMAVENGLKGLYMIGSFVEDPETKGLDASYIHEPAIQRLLIDMEAGESKNEYDYSEIWDHLLNFKFGEKTYYGGFVSYDDSPRRGDRGYHIEGFSVDSFGDYMSKLIRKNEKAGNELVFVNAWNEWGEGMYLEPDKKYGYEILKALRDAKDKAVKSEYKMPVQEDGLGINDLLYYEKDTLYLHLMDIWMDIREKGEKISDWLVENDINEVAVYGYGVFGKHLVNQLIQEQFDVLYVVDKMESKVKNIQFYTPDEDIPAAETLVVTAPAYYDEIYGNMKQYGYKQIISIRQILEEIYNDGIYNNAGI